MIRNCCYTSSFRFIYILLTHYSEGRIRKQGSRRKCCFNVYVCSDEFQENDDFFFFCYCPRKKRRVDFWLPPRQALSPLQMDIFLFTTPTPTVIKKRWISKNISGACRLTIRNVVLCRVWWTEPVMYSVTNCSCHIDRSHRSPFQACPSPTGLPSNFFTPLEVEPSIRKTLQEKTWETRRSEYIIRGK